MKLTLKLLGDHISFAGRITLSFFKLKRKPFFRAAAYYVVDNEKKLKKYTKHKRKKIRKQNGVFHIDSETLSDTTQFNKISTFVMVKENLQISMLVRV